MSEFTTCNYCTLKQIKTRAKQNGKIILKRPNKEHGGIDILVHGKGETPDRGKHFRRGL